MWPSKKISSIVHSVGSFDYLTYDSDGRLERQTFILPLRATGDLCQQNYDETIPCELVYSYSDDGHVSAVQANKTMDDGSVETSTYLFEWVDGNVVSITCDIEHTVFYCKKRYK